MRAVLAFAKSSLWAAALCLGASVWLASALVGSSMISLGHLVGSAVTCVALLGLAARGELASITYRPSRNHFAVLFAAVTAAWVAQGWAYYWSGVFAVWDIGIYADLLANLALRGSYYSHILKRHGFADHVTPSLTLLAPLFALKPTFLWLVAAKVCAALACSWLLWLLGREVLGRESRWLYALPMLCLMHTVLTYGYTFQFQPSVLAAPLSLVCFWLAIKERWMLLAAALLFTFGLREDQPLIGVCVGLFVWLERGHTRLGLSIVAASIVVGVVGFWGIAPAFAEGRFFQHGRFGPWVLWPEKARLYVVLLATVGALPLLRPRTLLWCTPILAVHFLSRMSGMQGFRHHYQVVPVVVFLVAALHGLAALEARRTWLDAQAPKRRALAIAGSLGLMVSLNGMLPHYSARLFWPTEETRAAIAELRTLRTRLPQDRVLYASDELIPHLVPHPKLRTVGLKHKTLPLRETVPHVVLLPLTELRWFAPGQSAMVRARMDDLAAQRSYRVEAFGAHFRLYRSPL